MIVLPLPFTVVPPLWLRSDHITKVQRNSSEIENFPRGFQNSLGYMFRGLFFPKELDLFTLYTGKAGYWGNGKIEWVFSKRQNPLSLASQGSAE